MSAWRGYLTAVCVGSALACTPLLENSDVTFREAGTEVVQPTGTLRDSGSGSLHAESGAASPDGVRFLTRLAAPAPHSQFGLGLAVAGHSLAVTAPFEDVARGAGVLEKAGATYLFDLSASPPSYERIIAFNADAKDGSLPPELTTAGVQQTDVDWPVLSVALSDTTLVVGAPAEASATESDPSDNSAPYSGAVYVYDRTRPGSAPQYLKAPNAEARDLFGFWVSLSGSWLAVGAPHESSGTAEDGSDNSAPNSGAVYVYHRNGEGEPFENPAYVKSPSIAAQVAFGETVAVTDDLLVVGAPVDARGGADVGDPNPASVGQSGTVYIYRRSSAGWTAEHVVKATKVEVGSYFGVALSSVSRGAFAVGAPQASGCNGSPASPTNQGAAYLVHEEPDGWKEECAEPEIGSGRILFGFGVGVLDSRLVVGAPWDARGPLGNMADLTPGAGSAYVYERSGSQLSGQYFKAPDPRWAGFGESLSVAPGYLVIGAPNEYDPPRARDAPFPTKTDPDPSGAVYVYSLQN